jgi:membrane fusion protein (multidrug efflux system)
MIVSAQAQLSSAQAAYDKAKIDLDRRRTLAPHGAVSGDELTSATNAFAAARASLEQARASVMQAGSDKGVAQGNFSATDALIAGTTVTNNPDVLAAQAGSIRRSWIWSAPSSARRSMAWSRAAACRSASAWPRATR